MWEGLNHWLKVPGSFIRVENSLRTFWFIGSYWNLFALDFQMDDRFQQCPLTYSFRFPLIVLSLSGTQSLRKKGEKRSFGSCLLYLRIYDACPWGYSNLTAIQAPLCFRKEDLLRFHAFSDPLNWYQSSRELLYCQNRSHHQRFFFLVSLIFPVSLTYVSWIDLVFLETLDLKMAHWQAYRLPQRTGSTSLVRFIREELFMQSFHWNCQLEQSSIEVFISPGQWQAFISLPHALWFSSSVSF